MGQVRPILRIRLPYRSDLRHEEAASERPLPRRTRHSVVVLPAFCPGRVKPEAHALVFGLVVVSSNLLDAFGMAALPTSMFQGPRRIQCFACCSSALGTLAL